MKSICFYFQIHQPFRLKRYRFFDIGSDHYYYDDYNNQEAITRLANNCYLPANNTILQMIKETDGAFKAAFSISGVALEQLELYAPEVIDSFKELAKTGCVEFLAETYAHSLASLRTDNDEFELQVKEHVKKIQSLFGVRPTVFRNTELIYSDEIGERVANMGFKGMLTEGAKHVLGWKSPNYVYCCSNNPQLKLLLKNSKLSNDITFRFSDWSWNQYPLTADKFMGWIRDTPEAEDVISLFMGYETFGEIQKSESGIFDFLKALPHFAKEFGIDFQTPSALFASRKPVDQINVPYPMSWADEERDLSAWLGNELQHSAFDKLYVVGEKVRLSHDKRLMQDWYYLQSSDHLYYMSTKSSSHRHNSSYDSPYDAFMNYMNVLSDFMDRINSMFPEGVDTEELNSLMKTIEAQGKVIADLEAKCERLESEAGRKATTKSSKKASLA